MSTKLHLDNVRKPMNQDVEYLICSRLLSFQGWTESFNEQSAKQDKNIREVIPVSVAIISSAAFKRTFVY